MRSRTALVDGPKLQRVLLAPSRGLRRGGRAVLEARLGFTLSALAILMVLKDGVSSSSNIAIWLHISQTFPGDPHLVPMSRYMLSSPIGPVAAHLLGLSSVVGYALLHLAVLLVGLVLLVTGLSLRGGQRAAVLGSVLFVASPLSDVLLSWLGMQDAWLFAAFCVLALFRQPVALAAAAAVAGLAHPEMAAIATLTLTALRCCESSDAQWRPQAAAMVCGLAVGCAGTFAYELHAGGNIFGDASFVGIVGLAAIVGDYLRCFPAWAWSTFGGGWPWAAAVVRGAKGTAAARVTALSLGTAATMSIVTLDETRVFALLSFPLVLWWTVRSVQRLSPTQLQTLTGLAVILAVAVPNLVAHAGHVTG